MEENCDAPKLGMQDYPNIEQKESVKITLNAKQQYQYEVKILEIDLRRLKEITDELNKIYNIKFGEKNA